MKRFILAILVCVSMCIGVVGCGSEAVEETSSSERAASVSNSNLKEDSSVIAVGKTTVSYKEYKTYYYFMKNQYESILGTDIWKYNKAVKDKSVGQEAIESVLRQIIQVKVIGKEAAIEKVQLATDEKEEADYRAKTVFDSIPAKDKQTQGIELKVLSKIFEENKLAQKMYNVQMGKLKIDYAANTLSAAKVELIYQAADQGITIFVTTHYMDEAEYCNRISIMVDGQIKALDTPARLKQQFGAETMDDVFQQLARGAVRKAD